MNVARHRYYVQYVNQVLLILLGVVCVTLSLPATVRADPRDELEKAQTFYGVKDYGRCLDIISEILATSDPSAPLRLEAQVLKARCLVRMGQPEAAKSAYLEALSIDRNWRPDPALQPADEVALFEEALAEFRELDQKRENHGSEAEIGNIPNCPSLTAPLVAAGMFAGATIYYFAARAETDQRWNDYAADPTHPADLYNDYESALGRENATGWVSIASGLVSGYLWGKFVKQHKNCSAGGGPRADLSLSLAPGLVALGGRF